MKLLHFYPILKSLYTWVLPYICYSGFSFHGILQEKILEWGSHSLLQRIFLTHGLKLHLLCLLNCRQTLYHLIMSETHIIYGSRIRQITVNYHYEMNFRNVSVGLYVKQFTFCVYFSVVKTDKFIFKIFSKSWRWILIVILIKM